MGEPVIIWPPGCGNFDAGDDGAVVCQTQNYQTDCTGEAFNFDDFYGTSDYSQAVANGYMLCC